MVSILIGQSLRRNRGMDYHFDGTGAGDQAFFGKPLKGSLDGDGKDGKTRLNGQDKGPFFEWKEPPVR